MRRKERATGLLAYVQVMDMIQGVQGKELPWEGASLSFTHRRRLGVFRESVMRLLARDAAQRSSMREFCASCDRLLASNTIERD